MTLAHSWLLILIAPFVSAVVLMRPGTRPSAWVAAACLSVIPAAILAMTAPSSFLPNFLWPGAQLGVTQLGRGWLAFTAVLWGAAAVYAVHSVPPGLRNSGRFWLLWMTACSGNLLLIISLDAISFYVGFSMMSLAAYALVVHDGTPTARRGGRLYLQLAILGEVLLLAGIIVQVEYSGSPQFTAWVTEGVSPWAVAPLICGLGLKAGFWPLHVWLPLAHPVAPAPASAVLSGAMIKAGILGIWAFLPPSELLAFWSPWLMTTGLISALFGVIAGLARSNVKQTLAYSSVSQMGYLLFIVAAGWQLPDERLLVGSALLVYVIHHGFAKGALFLTADLMKTHRLPDGSKRWGLAALIALPALALCGLPATSGAAAKTLLKGLLDSPALSAWVVWLQLGTLATTLLLARVLWLFYRDQQRAPVRAIAPLQSWPWALLCVMGLGSAWLWPTMQTPLFYALELATVFDAIWPIAAGLLIAAAALHWRWRVPAVVYDTRHPFERWSVRFRRRLNKPILPEIETPWLHESHKLLRRIERRWNRMLQGPTVNRSAALMIVFILLAATLIVL